MERDVESERPSKELFVDAKHSHAPVKPTQALNASNRYVRPVPSIVKRSKQPDIAHQWSVKTRLSGTLPEHFHPQGVTIVMTSKMEVPIEFQACSCVLDSNHRSYCFRPPPVLIFCDIYDDRQTQFAIDMSIDLRSSFDLQSPPVILVPHKSKPASQTQDPDLEFEVMSRCITAGIDGFLFGHPEGVELACQARSAFMNHSMHTNGFEKALGGRRDEALAYEEMKEDVQQCVWVYLNRMLKCSLPSIDQGIGELNPGEMIGDFVIGKQVGQGASGTVHQLHEQACFDATGATLNGQVIKMMPKVGRTTLSGLKNIDNEIRVMNQLSSSSWAHPNIIKLHEVYHTETHVVLRMQDGGPKSLYGYLRTYEMKRLPLGFLKVERIVKQAMDAIRHMHCGPQIAHRDIKPENILARETANGMPCHASIEIQICDFDLACIRPETGRFSPCGTFPFMAPEIMEKFPVDLFATDIWSLGVVFLEVLCCCNVVPKAILKGRSPTSKSDQKDMLRKIHAYFEQAESMHELLDVHLRPELKDHIEGGGMLPVLRGMLSVQADERWTAESVSHSLVSQGFGELKPLPPTSPNDNRNPARRNSGRLGSIKMKVSQLRSKVRAPSWITKTKVPKADTCDMSERLTNGNKVDASHSTIQCFDSQVAPAHDWSAMLALIRQSTPLPPAGERIQYDDSSQVARPRGKHTTFDFSSHRLEDLVLRSKHRAVTGQGKYHSEADTRACLKLEGLDLPSQSVCDYARTSYKC